MKRNDIKSHCPINFSLESFGDPWSLLIVRDIVYYGKKTYAEFLSSEEKISSNILANRLLQLQQKGILVKKTHPFLKRKEVYELTEKGLDLIPIILTLAGWGAKHDPETITPQTDASEIWFSALRTDREKVYKLIHETVKNGGSIFSGSNSVISQLNSHDKI
ncbi:winged helix-turn-helix transcriptional regulator [Shimazuella alba]|uniref:Transcriptional regulator n=1 Tax=Shimazuella alba TaxID=2690964 RepID=A0A6I4VRA4_9BACL|nr:helix-turn-helix domain-containing protein [Shimazuella alba]MXQ52948.1 transcriptional regulator [Shimazuella alba]